MLEMVSKYRNLEEMMQERGVDVDHTTIYRWIQYFAPQFEKKIRPHAKPIGFSWRIDKTYIKVKQRRVEISLLCSSGQTIDFMLSHKRDAASAKRFFKKALR